MKRGTVLVTGANGYIGNAVARAFRRAGWITFGLIRSSEHSADLARHEIHPVIGAPNELSFLEQLKSAALDVVVSNTEDRRDPVAHFESVRTMLDAIGRRSHGTGKRPLAMFTSGCKDYGKMNERHGDPGLAPHTEERPLNPPEGRGARSQFGASLLERQHALYDATVLRPTFVYGNSSSYYGALLELAAGSKSAFELVADPNSIMHSVDVDDCAEAYVALAEHPERNAIAQQAFNISNSKYEPARDIGEAFARSYGLESRFAAPTSEGALRAVHMLANFSQWVSSDRLRQLTGWNERKPPFARGIDEYRLAYEAHRPRP